MGGRVNCPYSVSTESTQSMNLTPIAANQTVLSFTNGAQVFFSYKTPVAAYCPLRGYIRTAKYWSTTTSRHINKWLKGVNNVTEVSQNYLYELGQVTPQFFFIACVHYSQFFTMKQPKSKEEKFQPSLFMFQKWLEDCPVKYYQCDINPNVFEFNLPRQSWT